MEDNNDKKLGRIVDHDTRSLTFAFDTTGLTIINVKHKRHIPILDQNPLSSCTGNAGIGSLATTPLFDNLTTPYQFTLDEPGAIQLWSGALKMDGGIGYPPQDYGSSGLSIAKVLYNTKMISGYQHTFTLEDALKAGSLYPFITGIPWYSDMFRPDTDGRVHPTGNIAGGHEIQMDEIDADNGRIWFCNSWNETWGVEGRFYLTWADYGNLLGQQGDVTILFPAIVTPPAPVYKTLRYGSTGDLVKTLQTLLNQSGAKLTVDGGFGFKTKAAVMIYQIKHSLVADGVVGPKTWAVLNVIPTPVLSKIDKWCEAAKQMEGAKLERNNPGNLRFVGQQYAINDNGFCKFDTYQHGYDALKSLITRACKGESKFYNPEGNLYDFYNVYAPANDGNDPHHYAEFVAGIIGVNPLVIIKTLL
jgi:hypothetical protein